MNVQRCLLVSLAAILSMTWFASPATAQPHSCEFWITVSDSDSPLTTETRYFGEYTGATYGVDGQINPTIIEECTEPGPGFDARWGEIPSRVAQQSWLCSPMPYNFQGFPTNALKCDTFNIQFVDREHQLADFVFRWPRHDYLAARCDSMIFRYGYLLTDSNGNLLTVRKNINMFNQDSAVIIRPQDLTLYYDKITNALIIKYGANMIDGVELKTPTAPSGFTLYQNYPNPFNPATAIQFELPEQSVVTLKVFDVLGQEIAPLADNQKFLPGEHTLSFNSTNFGSAIYFYQIRARSDEGKDFQQLKKMVLIK